MYSRKRQDFFDKLAGTSYAASFPQKIFQPPQNQSKYLQE
jgi:hypothetical protein